MRRNITILKTIINGLFAASLSYLRGNVIIARITLAMTEAQIRTIQSQPIKKI